MPRGGGLIRGDGPRLKVEGGNFGTFLGYSIIRYCYSLASPLPHLTFLQPIALIHHQPPYQLSQLIRPLCPSALTRTVIFSRLAPSSPQAHPNLGWQVPSSSKTVSPSMSSTLFDTYNQARSSIESRIPTHHLNRQTKPRTSSVTSLRSFLLMENKIWRGRF